MLDVAPSSIACIGVLWRRTHVKFRGFRVGARAGGPGRHKRFRPAVCESLRHLPWLGMACVSAIVPLRQGDASRSSRRTLVGWDNWSR